MVIIVLAGCDKSKKPETEGNTIDNNEISETINNDSNNHQNSNEEHEIINTDSENDQQDDKEEQSAYTNDGSVTDQSVNEENESNTGNESIDEIQDDGVTDNLNIEIGENEEIGGL